MILTRDFHQMVADMAGEAVSRKEAKIIGLGLMYGMGKSKLAASLDMDLESASELINEFHERSRSYGARSTPFRKN